MTSVLRELSINAYLSELAKKNNSQYSYGITPVGSSFHINIYKQGQGQESGSVKTTTVFSGPILVKDAHMDMYYIDFPKVGVRCLIYFFM